MADHPFEPGKVYNRVEDIHERYGGSHYSGISTPADAPWVFLFTGEAGKAYGYEDEYDPETGKFFYTGEGQVGDMQMMRGNRAIRNHQENEKGLLVFEKVATGRVRFVGEAVYLDHHRRDLPDRNGDMRSAIVFELEVEPEGIEEAEREEVPPEPTKWWTMEIEELRDVAETPAPKKAERTLRERVVRQRSKAVRVYVLRRAGGVCEACGSEAPFKTRQGRPYLEPHHIARMADGGPDHPRSVAAICPNCHREVHHGKDGDELNERIAEVVGRKENDEGRGVVVSQERTS